jgi:hypothetical protein
MAFTGNFMATSFKQEILQGVHNFTTSTGDSFKLALYDNSASFTAATTAYTVTNEVGNSGSYSAGGGARDQCHAHNKRHAKLYFLLRMLRRLSSASPDASGVTGHGEYHRLEPRHMV